MTKITCFSDTHGQHRHKDLNYWMHKHPSEILVFAGDAIKSRRDESVDFIDWINELPYEYKIISFGNHDQNYQLLEDRATKYKNIHIINQESISVKGIKFYGCPYSVKNGDWNFVAPDDKLSVLYQRIPSDTSVLVTHTPPYGILDVCADGHRAGSKSLAKRINELPEIKYSIFGHIHESYGLYAPPDKQMFYINCSVLNESYIMDNAPIVFDYDTTGGFDGKKTRKR